MDQPAKPDLSRLAELMEKLPQQAEAELARMFVDGLEHELRYVNSWGWIYYDGTRWRRDEVLRAQWYATEFCRDVARRFEAPRVQCAIASARTIFAVERLARGDDRLAATPDLWDAEALLLNSPDATIDLCTGIGHPPDPLDFLMRVTACPCAPPGTPHPRWTKFLYRVTNNDVELIEFLQRYCGYALTGLTTEHAFVFAHGGGANGKTTFTNTIGGILGDYTEISDTATLVASSNERHPTDLAKLAGARLVVAQETAKGRRWDETRIKCLTGGDKITARFMRKDFFNFTPVLKLLVCGNHKPRLATVDEAMRRRLLLVPFTVQIPPAERDRDLGEKLKAEWPAILRWMLDGCLAWQRTGLAPPAAVREASEAYFADQDTIGQWLDEQVRDGGSAAFTPTKALFGDWKVWAESNNLKPGSLQAFSEALSARGYKKKREGGTGRQGFAGLVLGAKL
jgi:putative DNA primase/helicase